VYDRQQQTYKLNDNGKLKREEVFVLGKILLGSRALNHDEFSDVFEKMILCCTSKNDFPLVQKMLFNERFHYIELSHKKHIIRTIWDLGCAVQNYNLIDIAYERLTEPRLKTRQIKPVGIMFSDFYFYLFNY
jgi:predicted DNA-binding transcriptional regulator YafY